jgi:hypothetical protein
MRGSALEKSFHIFSMMDVPGMNFIWTWRMSRKMEMKYVFSVIHFPVQNTKYEGIPQLIIL